MPQDLINSINQYGYLLLFFLVFIQEIGVPTFPNEITLCYFGFLCSQQIYSIETCLITAISADIIGTTLLYFLFFYFGKSILNSNNKILQRISKNVVSLKNKEKYKSKFSFMLCRLTPFIRGYVSVFAGTTQYSYKFYVIQIIISAILFTGGFVLIGYFLSSQVQFIISLFQHAELVKIMITITILIVSLKWGFKKYVTKKQ